MSETRTFRDAVAREFILRKGQWIDARELMEIGGLMAWRTRVSNCRTQLGMTIRNRTRKVGDITVSEYIYSESNLMAAAPDLYAALAAVLRAYDGPTVDAANAVSGCMAAARAALAAAKAPETTVRPSGGRLAARIARRRAERGEGRR